VPDIKLEEESRSYPSLNEAMKTMSSPVQQPKSVDGRFPLRSRITMPTEGEEMKVVGKVTDLPVKPGDREVKDFEAELGPLVRDATDEKSGALTKGELRSPDSLKLVQLWVQKPDGTYHKHSETMTPDEVEKMNLDPIPFLKRMFA